MTPYRAVVEHLLRGVTDANVVVGPPLWHPRGGAYFIVAVRRGKAFAPETVKAQAGVDIAELRDGFLRDLSLRPALVVHDIDDELETVEACESLWPCEAIKAIRGRIEAARLVARLHAAPLRGH